MFDYKDKSYNINLANQYTLAKTLSMFDYEGLPDSIPERELERLLQETGKAFIYKWDNEIYAFRGSLTGETDTYGNALEININHQGKNENRTVKISDGILILNDDYKLGILKLIEQYNFLLNENLINMVLYGYNNRIHKIISASDDSTLASAEDYLDKVVDGELAVIGENQFLQDLKIQGLNTGATNTLSSLIEYNQYLKANLYNELGIQANTNNKKERLITAEVEQDKELVYPLVNNMFLNRVLGVEELNRKFDLDVAVEYGSVWKYRNIDKEGEDYEVEGVENGGAMGGDPLSDEDVTQ